MDGRESGLNFLPINSGSVAGPVGAVALCSSLNDAQASIL